jgi:hypothetical protein
MQRTLLIILATAVVAAGFATTATILLTGDEDPQTILAPPSPSPVATPEASGEPTTSPEASASPDATDDPSGPSNTSGTTATSTPDATAGGVTIRTAKSVDCDDEPKFCSSEDAAVIEDGDLKSKPVSGSDPNSSSYPTIVMTSEVRKDSKNETSVGGAARFIHVDVVVTNKTDDTFRFAKREVVMELYRNGKLLDQFATTGEGFDMTPNSKMNASFDRPLLDDGTYRWRTKVWYYKK